MLIFLIVRKKVRIERTIITTVIRTPQNVEVWGYALKSTFTLKKSTFLIESATKSTTVDNIFFFFATKWPYHLSYYYKFIKS